MRHDLEIRESSLFLDIVLIVALIILFVSFTMKVHHELCMLYYVESESLQPSISL